MKHPCDIFKVAGQCGVRLLDPVKHRPGKRRVGECFAKRTLKKIGQRHGEAHLALVLRLIVETEGNGGELYRETVQAVSSVLVGSPSLVCRGGRLFEEFDRISLADVRRQAKALAGGMPVSQVMRVLIALRLHTYEEASERAA